MTENILCSAINKTSKRAKKTSKTLRKTSKILKETSKISGKTSKKFKETSKTFKKTSNSFYVLSEASSITACRHSRAGGNLICWFFNGDKFLELRMIAPIFALGAILKMNFTATFNKLNIPTVYVYIVSALMITEVIVYRINEQFDWIIRKQLFDVIPTSLHQSYLGLQFLLLLFSMVNIIVIPIIGIMIFVTKKGILPVIVSLIASLLYYLLLRELGDGII